MEMLGLNENDIVQNGSFVPFTSNYWNCDDWDEERNQCFPDETSVGEIFISENLSPLRKDCKFEFNCGDIDRNSLLDSSGNSNKGILIGEYKIKKPREGKPVRRDSYIKVPKRNNNRNGAL